MWRSYLFAQIKQFFCINLQHKKVKCNGFSHLGYYYKRAEVFCNIKDSKGRSHARSFREQRKRQKNLTIERFYASTVRCIKHLLKFSVNMTKIREGMCKFTMGIQYDLVSFSRKWKYGSAYLVVQDSQLT